jgi:hypothetical protein
MLARTDAESELHKVHQELTAKTHMASECDKSFHEKEAELSETMTDSADLQDQLDISQTAVEELQETTEQLQKQFSDLRENCATREIKCEAVTKSYTEAMALKKGLQNDLEAARAEVQASHAEVHSCPPCSAAVAAAAAAAAATDVEKPVKSDGWAVKEIQSPAAAAAATAVRAADPVAPDGPPVKQALQPPPQGVAEMRRPAPPPRMPAPPLPEAMVAGGGANDPQPHEEEVGVEDGAGGMVEAGRGSPDLRQEGEIERVNPEAEVEHDPEAEGEDVREEDMGVGVEVEEESNLHGVNDAGAVNARANALAEEKQLRDPEHGRAPEAEAQKDRRHQGLHDDITKDDKDDEKDDDNEARRPPAHEDADHYAKMPDAAGEDRKRMSEREPDLGREEEVDAEEHEEHHVIDRHINANVNVDADEPALLKEEEVVAAAEEWAEDAAAADHRLPERGNHGNRRADAAAVAAVDMEEPPADPVDEHQAAFHMAVRAAKLLPSLWGGCLAQSAADVAGVL